MNNAEIQHLQFTSNNYFTKKIIIIIIETKNS